MTFEPLEGMDAMLDQMACEYSGEKLPAYRSGITDSLRAATFILSTGNAILRPKL